MKSVTLLLVFLTVYICVGAAPTLDSGLSPIDELSQEKSATEVQLPALVNKVHANATQTKEADEAREKKTVSSLSGTCVQIKEPYRPPYTVCNSGGGLGGATVVSHGGGYGQGAAVVSGGFVPGGEVVSGGYGHGAQLVVNKPVAVVSSGLGHAGLVSSGYGHNPVVVSSGGYGQGPAVVSTSYGSGPALVSSGGYGPSAALVSNSYGHRPFIGLGLGHSGLALGHAGLGYGQGLGLGHAGYGHGLGLGHAGYGHELGLGHAGYGLGGGGLLGGHSGGYGGGVAVPLATSVGGLGYAKKGYGLGGYGGGTSLHFGGLHTGLLGPVIPGASFNVIPSPYGHLGYGSHLFSPLSSHYKESEVTDDTEARDSTSTKPTQDQEQSGQMRQATSEAENEQIEQDEVNAASRSAYGGLALVSEVPNILPTIPVALPTHLQPALVQGGGYRLGGGLVSAGLSGGLTPGYTNAGLVSGPSVGVFPPRASACSLPLLFSCSPHLQAGALLSPKPVHAPAYSSYSAPALVHSAYREDQPANHASTSEHQAEQQNHESKINHDKDDHKSAERTSASAHNAHGGWAAAPTTN